MTAGRYTSNIFSNNSQIQTYSYVLENLLLFENVHKTSTATRHCVHADLEIFWQCKILTVYCLCVE